MKNLIVVILFVLITMSLVAVTAYTLAQTVHVATTPGGP